MLHIWLEYRILEQILALIAPMLRIVGLLILVIHNDYGVSERILDFILAINLDLGTLDVPVTFVAP